MRTRRVLFLAMLFLAAACAAQAGAPHTLAPSAAPSVRTASGLADAHDAIYVRESGRGMAISPYITRLDVSSGLVQGALPDGIVSADSTRDYEVVSVDGATRTRISEIDVDTGNEIRVVTVDGDWMLAQTPEGPVGLSEDGRRLVLARRPQNVDGKQVSGFAVVDLLSGRITATAQFKDAKTSYSVLDASKSGEAVIVARYGVAPVQLGIWDVASRGFVRWGGSWDGTEGGFTTTPLRSTDGERLYLLDSGGSGGPRLDMVDLVAHRLVQLELPASQRSSDGERFLLWSLALSPDGSTLYAVNAALGAIDEVDARGVTLKRSATFRAASAISGPLARVARFFFPVAEAKRFLRGGALAAPRGHTLYAAGEKGVAVIDTASLRLRDVWAKASALDSLALSPDGRRLYVVDDNTRDILAIASADGALLGRIHQGLAPSDIVRVEPSHPVLLAPTDPAPCDTFAFIPPDPEAPVEVTHLKTSATVVETTSACTVRVRIAGGQGGLDRFAGREVILRATSSTTFASASKGDPEAIGAMRLRRGDVFTLAFDGRAYPDGSYPIELIDR